MGTGMFMMLVVLFGVWLLRMAGIPYTKKRATKPIAINTPSIKPKPESLLLPLGGVFIIVVIHITTFQNQNYYKSTLQV